MTTDFEHWLRAQFADTGPFTIFILLVRITSSNALPLRSSYAHLIGDEMTWQEMRTLLDGARCPGTPSPSSSGWATKAARCPTRLPRESSRKSRPT